MTIHEFELDDDIKEADADELLDTLNEFMQKHEENVEAYRELETEYSDAEDEIDEKQGTVDTLKTHFAEEVAENSPLFDADEVADRFNAQELMEKAGSAETEFSEEDDPEGDTETKFSDKEQKSREDENGGSETTTFSDQAREDYQRLMGVDLE